jgi:hypothetical protein
MTGRVEARRRWGALALVAAIAGFGMGACGGGGAAVGDDCETPGSTEECEDGAICDADSDLGTVCMTLCEKDEDCKDGETCNGTSGSLKGCHPN